MISGIFSRVLAADTGTDVCGFTFCFFFFSLVFLNLVPCMTFDVGLLCIFSSVLYINSWILSYSKTVHTVMT